MQTEINLLSEVSNSIYSLMDELTYDENGDFSDSQYALYKSQVDLLEEVTSLLWDAKDILEKVKEQL